MHLVFPLRILHNQCFQILQGITVVPREIENNRNSMSKSLPKKKFSVKDRGSNETLGKIEADF